jgi:hypothetical protein
VWTQIDGRRHPWCKAHWRSQACSEEGFRKDELVCCRWSPEYSGILLARSKHMGIFLKQE